MSVRGDDYRKLQTLHGSLARTLEREGSDFLLVLAAEVSAWSVGQHIDHLLKVETTVLRSISEGLSDETAQGMNAIGRVLLALGWLPRGVAESPKAVLGVQPTLSDLVDRLGTLQSLGEKLALSPEKLGDRSKRMKHPRFGSLSAPEWIRFLNVHHHHHQKIIRDVLRKKKRSPS